MGSSAGMIHNGEATLRFPRDIDTPMRNATPAVLCIAIAACSPVKPHASQGYRDGYIADCSSGQVYAGKSGPEAPRDNARYGTDADYTQGWNEGQQECYTQAMASPRNWGGTGGR